MQTASTCGIDLQAVALHVIEAKGLDASDRHVELDFERLERLALEVIADETEFVRAQVTEIR